jgi:hypothetical protein
MSAEYFPVNTFPEEMHEGKLANARKYLKVLWEEFKAIE